MNKPVSYKLAKLLKEKGIIFETEIYYSSVTKVTSVSYTEIAAPTIAEVVMWLYEKHGIWISVFNDDVNFFWMGIVLNTKERLRDGNAREFNSPTEAYEAGIEYTLNNLI